MDDIFSIPVHYIVSVHVRIHEAFWIFLFLHGCMDDPKGIFHMDDFGSHFDTPLFSRYRRLVI